MSMSLMSLSAAGAYWKGVLVAQALTNKRHIIMGSVH